MRLPTLCLALALAGCQGLASAPAGYAGTIEVTELELGPAVPGRLTAVHFAEGDAVSAGDLAFTLEATNLAVQLDLARAATQVADAGIEAARAQVRTANAQVTVLKREVERLQRMEAAGVGSPQQRSTLEGQLAVAQAQAAGAHKLVAQAEAGAAQAAAAVAAAEEALDETRVQAAIDGVVLSRNREPGEVVTPGASVLTLGDLAHPRLRIYVPLTRVEGLELGQAVTVRVDADPEAPIQATVAKVAREAEFTPRDILTPEERVKRVFAVDLALEPGPGLLPGVPAEASLD